MRWIYVTGDLCTMQVTGWKTCQGQIPLEARCGEGQDPHRDIVPFGWLYPA